MPLRAYQQRAHDAVITHIKKSICTALIEAVTAAGKSHIIAAVAQSIYEMSNGKSVLCLAPSKELVEQNREKYLATGNPASMYSASAGRKCLKHPVVFGTPLTVKNATDKIAKNIAAVIIDEAHGLTPTIKKIIDELRVYNPNLRVIGFTATPYRLTSGYIYEIDDKGEPVEEANNPYFKYLLTRITGHELIELGYITKPIIGDNVDSYDTKNITINRMGNFVQSELDKATLGKGRLTSRIIADIVEKAQGRRGVMIFASSVKHAKECMESLPHGLSEIVTGDTPKKEREKTLKRFKAGEIKYLVNVSVLTTGFDAPNVDTIALLRPTESVALLQQCIGRGLRLLEGKTECLVLDYAGNIEKHAPDGDIFNPEITAPRKSDKGGKIKALCPSCGYDNVFSVHMDRLEYDFDENGYALDLEGLPVKTDNGDPLPVHHGRRCEGVIHTTGDRCGYRWTHKKCEECGEENDIAARNCRSCNAEIVDPNTKLKEEFVRKKTNPYEVSTDKVLEWHVQNTVSNGGNPMYKVTFKTEYALPVAYFLYEKNFDNWRKIKAATNNMQEMPKTITYYKKQGSKFWEILDYNRPVDEDPR